MFSLEFIGFTLGTLGKIMIGFMAIMVHHRVRKEHKIDERVFKSMRREQVIGIIGITFIIIGYFLQLPSFL